MAELPQRVADMVDRDEDLSQLRELEGKTFVLMGSVEKFTRSEAKNLIESMGGRATSSGSGETDYLVAGDNPGSKLDEAKKHKVKIIEEKEFEKLVGIT